MTAPEPHRGHPHGAAGRRVLHGLVGPHRHDPADSIDDAMEASTAGVRALKISMFLLLGTTLLQFLVV
ncbi:MAG: cation transporter, partial [Actinomycetes bacterium]